jgi:hypothetical protein
VRVVYRRVHPSWAGRTSRAFVLLVVLHRLGARPPSVQGQAGTTPLAGAARLPSGRVGRCSSPGRRLASVDRTHRRISWCAARAERTSCSPSSMRFRTGRLRVQLDQVANVLPREAGATPSAAVVLTAQLFLQRSPRSSGTATGLAVDAKTCFSNSWTRLFSSFRFPRARSIDRMRARSISRH